MTSGYKIFARKEAPPIVLGDVLIVTAFYAKHPKRYNAEYYILTQHPEHRLIHKGFSLNASGADDEVINIDDSTILTTALDVAQSDIAVLLRKIYEETKNIYIYSGDISYEEVEAARLARSWISGIWTEEIKDMRDKSQCEKLIEFLHSVMDLPTIKIQ